MIRPMRELYHHEYLRARECHAVSAVIDALEARCFFDGAPLTHFADTLPSPRYGISVASVGKTVLFYGSDSGPQETAVDRLDTTTNTWKSDSLTHVSDIASAVATEQKAGFANDIALDIYDGDSGEWTTGKLPGLPRVGVEAAAAKDHMLFAGGYISDDTSFAPQRTVNVLNTATGEWSTAQLSQARYYIQSVKIRSQVLFAGGHRTSANSATDTSDAVDIYDAASGLWSSARLSLPRSGMSIASVGTKVLFAGGTAERTDQVDVYDSATGRWSVTRMPNARRALSSVAVGTKVLLFGESLPVADVYDSVTGLWSARRLPRPRTDVSSAALGTKALLAGGVSGDQDANAAIVDVYDVATGRWATAPLSIARDGMDVVSIGKRAVFASGTGNLGAQGAVDVYTDRSPRPVASGYLGSGRTSVGVWVRNAGDAPLAAGTLVSVYATPSLAFGRSAVRVGKIRTTSPLKPGQFVRLVVPLDVPDGMAEGTYHLQATTGSGRSRAVFAGHRRALTVDADPDTIARAASTAVAGLPKAGAPFGLQEIAQREDEEVWA